MRCPSATSTRTRTAASSGTRHSTLFPTPPDFAPAPGATSAAYIQPMPAKEATPFSETLDRRVDEGALGTLYEKLPDNQVRCYACAHRCLIKDGLRGICKGRYTRGGTLMVPRGYVGALQCDPIEKKPFFHAYPGTDALTFGMLGCDLHCSYCFTGDVRVATNSGMRRFDDLWQASTVDPNGDLQRRRPPDG